MIGTILLLLLMHLMLGALALVALVEAQSTFWKRFSTTMLRRLGVVAFGGLWFLVGFVLIVFIAFYGMYASIRYGSIDD